MKYRVTKKYVQLHDIVVDAESPMEARDAANILDADGETYEIEECESGNGFKVKQCEDCDELFAQRFRPFVIHWSNRCEKCKEKLGEVEI